MNSKYYDSKAAIQVLGCALNDPTYLDEDSGEYFYNEEDFQGEFHKTLAGVLYNMRKMGSEKLTIPAIMDYASERPNILATFKAHSAEKMLARFAAEADIINFDYNYNRLKKMTLLRCYESIGMDMSFLYDPNALIDPEKKQKQLDYLDKMTLAQIADTIESRIELIKATYVDNSQVDDVHLLSENIDSIFAKIGTTPSFGPMLYGGDIMHNIHRGARMGTYYLRSAPSGVGNIRSF